jgi:hypothetical protein
MIENTTGGQKKDNPLVLHQFIGFDMQRPGKQQKPQHPFQQKAIEIDALNKSRSLIPDVPAGVSDDDQNNRKHQRKQHQSICLL